MKAMCRQCGVYFDPNVCEWDCPHVPKRRRKDDE